MGQKRCRFSEKFKREAVRRAFEEGRAVSEVARELDVRADMLRRGREVEHPSKKRQTLL